MTSTDPERDAAIPDTRLPASIDDITAAWLTSLLQASHPGVRVTHAAVRHVEVGTTTHLRMRLAYAPATVASSLPARVFMKTSIGNPNHRDLADLQLYGTELRFYRRLAPLLPVPTPTAVIAAFDRADGGFALAFEDLVEAGATWGSSLRPLTLPQAEAIASSMAAYHAKFWGGHASTAWLATAGSEPLTQVRRSAAYTPESIAALLELPRAASVPAALRRPAKLSEAFWEVLHRNAQGPLCVLHGDPHVGNLAFSPDGTVVFTDWQLVCRGRWAYDVTFALVGGLSNEDRGRHFDHLLGRSLDELARRGVDAPAPDPARRAVAESVMHGLMIFLYNPASCLPEEVNTAYVERFASAASEWGSLAKALAPR
jgi:hypothetical protein